MLLAQPVPENPPGRQVRLRPLDTSVGQSSVLNFRICVFIRRRLPRRDSGARATSVSSRPAHTPLLAVRTVAPQVEGTPYWLIEYAPRYGQARLCC